MVPHLVRAWGTYKGQQMHTCITYKQQTQIKTDREIERQRKGVGGLGVGVGGDTPTHIHTHTQHLDHNGIDYLYV